jgi:hypothetical protein
MIHLCTFTDDRMTISANLCAQSAQRNGADSYSIWTPGDLSAEFKETHAELLKQERGFGFWCWKPYIVHREMCKLQDGDVLVYCDAGNEWISDMRQAINCMDQDILFFSNGWRHIDWCKMDCTATILPAVYFTSGRLEDWNVKQVQASTFFVRVTPETRKFIQEWYAWSLVPGMVDNEPSKLPNIPTFSEHRHDQAILTNLQIKYGYRLHWFPTTSAHFLKDQHPEDRYPTLLNHHRRRNHEY